MANEERNKEQAPSNPYAAGGQPPYPPSPGTPPPYPYPPPPAQQPAQGTPPPYPYMPTPAPQQPITGGDIVQNFPIPPPYAPAQQPIMGGAPQGYPPMQQPPYPQHMGSGEITHAYAPPPAPYPYTPPVAPKKSNRGLKILLIVLAVIIVLGASGGGVLIYILTRPQPVITVSSNYKVGTTPAGSTGTTFHVVGQKFSGSEAITFLLDGAPVPGSQVAHSDKDGTVTTNLTVNASWGQTDHTITAKDADGYTTKIGAKITIVPQGEAHTPGPNGAPPDDVTGIVVATVKFNTNAQNNPPPLGLQITGRPDPQGGLVCGNNDNNKPITNNSTVNGIAVTEVVTLTCSGTYKAGKLSYTETVTSDKGTLTANGATVNCSTVTSYVRLHLDGTFTSATTISGVASSDKVVFICDQGVGPLTLDADTGTWTGTMLQTGNSNV